MIPLQNSKLSQLCGLDSQTQVLLQLYHETPDADKVARWFDSVLFETLRPEVTCLAAAMGAGSEYAGIPGSQAPRLRGLMKYVHTLNAGMCAGLFSLGPSFQAAGITPLLMRSTAVHLGYPAAPQHHLWQLEVAVPPKQYTQAAKLAADAGFTLTRKPDSITARSGSTRCLVLYRQDDFFLQGVKELHAGNMTLLLPDSGLLLIMLAEELIRLLLCRVSGPGLIPLLMDLRCIIQQTTDWQAVAATAGVRGCRCRMQLVLSLCKELMPGLISAELISLFSSPTTTDRLCDQLLAFRTMAPGQQRLKKHWLLAKIQSADHPGHTAGCFFRDLLRAAAVRISPELQK